MSRVGRAIPRTLITSFATLLTKQETLHDLIAKHPSLPLTDAQITEILAKMDVLVELVAPLKALLAGAAGMTGGAGQRLEELIQQLTSVSAGLHQNVEDLIPA